MKNVFRLVVFALLMGLSMQMAYADEPKKNIIYMDKGDKKIRVQELGFAPSTPIIDVLRRLPEMLARGNEDFLVNYTVTVDDQDVNVLKYVILSQTTVSEIDLIEISENASASYSSNGATGSINLVPVKTREGLSGNAVMDASTETDVQGSANVYWKKEALEIRGSAHLESYLVADYSESQYWRAQRMLLQSNTTSSNAAWAENAHMFLRYFITPKDRLQVRLWESYGSSNKTSSVEALDEQVYENPYTSLISQTDNYDSARSVVAFAYADYRHFFSKDRKLTFETSYKYNGKSTAASERSYILDTQNNVYNYTTSLVHPHDVLAKLYYDDLFKWGDHSLKLKLGTQFNYDASRTNTTDTSSANQSYATSEARVQHYSVSPYTDITYLYSHWLTMTLSGRYRYDAYQDPLNTQKADYNSYLAQLLVDVFPAQGHSIRLAGVRNFLTPTLQGETGYTYCTNVLYMYDGLLGEHHLNSELGAVYTWVNNLAQNNKYNVGSLRAAIRWRYRWISLSLAANVFSNISKSQQAQIGLGTSRYYTYYNILFMPVFNLPKDWQISVQALYNSKVETEQSVNAPYFLTSARVSKHIGPWSFHLEWNDPIHYKITDQTYNASTGITYYNTGYLYKNSLLIGVNYTF